MKFSLIAGIGFFRDDVTRMKRHGAVRSIFGSLQYTPSFYEDFVAMQRVTGGALIRLRGGLTGAPYRYRRPWAGSRIG